MLELDEKILDIAGHIDATVASHVVLIDFYTCKFITGHVELDPVELLENIKEIVEVFDANILNPKVINLDEWQFYFILCG